MKTNNICIGTGLVALDVILNGKPERLPKLTAGGSCGNVLSILAFLGWRSFPIARFSNNLASAEIEKDFRRWKVDTKLISKTKDGSTPIIIHRILKDKSGNPKHRFEFKDPDTGKWLPQYKPVLSKNVDSIVLQKPHKPNFFYFDRIHRSSIELGKFYRDKGAVVFFEPSSVGSKIDLFKEALSVAHIVKFSSERIKDYSLKFKSSQVPLEIETLGAKGLRFRFSAGKKETKWRHVAAPTILEVVDAAGAGDWCTAGIIHFLSSGAKGSFEKMSLSAIESALNFGQSLGALNCCFDGARGAMYNLTTTQVLSLSQTIVNSGALNLKTFETTSSLEGQKIRIRELLV